MDANNEAVPAITHTAMENTGRAVSNDTTYATDQVQVEPHMAASSQAAVKRSILWRLVLPLSLTQTADMAEIDGDSKAFANGSNEAGSSPLMTGLTMNDGNEGGVPSRDIGGRVEAPALMYPTVLSIVNHESRVTGCRAVLRSAPVPSSRGSMK